ncbi:hypothetical protein [Shewanella halifaxensis]|uniref:hypothetical protein n=1 Tax=Shewanella halifaxensis TaxID=271098 RepID=UPI000D59AA6F|nr:hypothetical protein [Shewanella halifaxensis]
MNFCANFEGIDMKREMSVSEVVQRIIDDRCEMASQVKSNNDGSINRRYKRLMGMFNQIELRKTCNELGCRVEDVL